MSRIACPCCGYIVFEERGGWEICPICYWEDDPVQIADPYYEGGANTPNLKTSQENFITFGAMEQRFVENVRAPTGNDRVEVAWRLVELEDKQFVTTPREIEERRGSGADVPYEYWLRKTK